MHEDIYCTMAMKFNLISLHRGGIIILLIIIGIVLNQDKNVLNPMEFNVLLNSVLLIEFLDFTSANLNNI